MNNKPPVQLDRGLVHLKTIVFLQKPCYNSRVIHSERDIC